MIFAYLNSAARRWLAVATGIVAISAAVVTVWAFDRALPSEFVGVKSVKQLDPTTLIVVQAVERKRLCETWVPLRYLESPHGSRLYLETVRLSRAEMERIQRESPNEVSLLLTLPQTHASGEWSYNISLEFVCNPLHELFPIRNRYTFKFPVVQ